MNTRDDAGALVLRMQECFNTRQFDEAEGLFTPDYYSHALGTIGFEAGKEVWRQVVTQFPDMRVVAEDVLVDGDKVAIRSSVHGITTPDGAVQPTLIEIFRIEDGRLAETWGITEGPDPRSR
ncbi:nuclear transport factor 2 family protein [Dactylosporangium sp. NPDC050588]|uniref:ester cyclase n=1 Tax=Dactylosporangium sp. NPDC050588 TaxID=3157211 RepID=UPI0033D70827